VKRMLPVPLVLAVAFALGPAAPAGDAVVVARVAVKMTDYEFALSKTAVPHGLVLFSVTNKGEVVHDFKIAGKKTPTYTGGTGGVLRVTFKKAGRYAYLCTIPGHAEAGMKGILRVK
jgi:uncharacterized cupredoxin-like copper-binding protein